LILFFLFWGIFNVTSIVIIKTAENKDTYKDMQRKLKGFCFIIAFTVFSFTLSRVATLINAIYIIYGGGTNYYNILIIVEESLYLSVHFLLYNLLLHKVTHPKQKTSTHNYPDPTTKDIVYEETIAGKLFP